MNVLRVLHRMRVAAPIAAAACVVASCASINVNNLPQRTAPKAASGPGSHPVPVRRRAPEPVRKRTSSECRDESAAPELNGR